MAQAKKKIEEKKPEVSVTDRIQNLLDNYTLSEVEQDAFSDMLKNLNTGRYSDLTVRQLDWLKRTEEKVGADTPVYENMVSSGKVTHTKGSFTNPLLQYQNLPRRPPGRK